MMQTVSMSVQHALARLPRAGRVTVRNAPEKNDGGLGFVRSGCVYRDVTRSFGSDRFAHVPTPADAKPGDVLVKPGHLRLVAGKEIAPAGAAILHLVESTSATSIPESPPPFKTHGTILPVSLWTDAKPARNGS